MGTLVYFLRGTMRNNATTHNWDNTFRTMFVHMISISPTEQQYNQATKGVTTYNQVNYDYSALEHWNILANLT